MFVVGVVLVWILTLHMVKIGVHLLDVSEHAAADVRTAARIASLNLCEPGVNVWTAVLLYWSVDRNSWMLPDLLFPFVLTAPVALTFVGGAIWWIIGRVRMRASAFAQQVVQRSLLLIFLRWVVATAVWEYFVNIDTIIMSDSVIFMLGPIVVLLLILGGVLLLLVSATWGMRTVESIEGGGQYQTP